MAKKEAKEAKIKNEDILIKEEDDVEKEKPIESKYSRKELLNNASAFGVMPEVIAGALALANKNEMTKKEAEAAVKRFLERKCS